jgi:hypothetical protein
MTYSHKKRNNGVRWLVCSWLVLLIVGGFIGFGIGKVSPAEQTPVSEAQNTPDAAQTPLPEYGTRDGRTFATTEMSMDWEVEDTFQPLDCALDAGTQTFIYYLSKGYYIDFPFVMGLIQQESTFRPNIISATNDYGLMQINIQNHKWLSEQLGIDDFLDPTQNIRAGLYILRNLFEKYDDPAKVLMAYNLGEGGAKSLWERGIYETAYSNSVLAHVQVFQNEITERTENND